MAYEQQFLEARKQFHQKIQTFFPSKNLLAIIDEDKPKQLAHKLDEGKSKPYRQMEEAFNFFDSYRLAYIKKINDQIARESQAAKLKPTINLMMAKLEKLCEDYEKECETKRKVEIQAAKAAEDLKKEEKADLKDDVTKIAEEYKKRGETYLSMASKLEKELALATKTIKTEIDEAHKKLLKINGKPTGDEKKQSITKLEASYKKLKEAWEKAEKSHRELNDLKNEDGNLKPEDLAKELRMQLPNTVKPELEKAYRTNNKSFVRANQIVADIDKKFKPEADLVNLEMKKISAAIKDGKKA